MLEAAERAAADGAGSFGVVIAGRGVSQAQRPDEFATLLEAIALIDDETDLRVDASLGALTSDEAEALAEAGVAVYNHNVETSRQYFQEVVSTHTFGDRIKTLETARAAGMALCAGVVLGMGETPTDRIDAAITLRDVGVDSLPVNVLNPVDGTPVADRVGTEAAITTAALRRTTAIYRLIHPRAHIRLAGGRKANVPADDQHRLLKAGANGLLIGDYLTTDGQTPERDRRIVERAGLRLAGSE
jgi:biotin synthase